MTTADAELVPFPTDAAQSKALHYRERLERIYGLHSTIARVRVFGRRGSSPIHIDLVDGTEIRLEAAQAYKVSELHRVLAAFTNGRSALPSDNAKPAELRKAFELLMRLADIEETDDEVAEVHEWVQRFLRLSGGTYEEADLTDGAATYEALGLLQSVAFYAHTSRAPALLRDTATGEVHARISDLVTYVRDVIGVKPLSAATLNARMAEAGYDRRVLQQWRPGANRRAYPKRKVSTYVLSGTTDGEQT